MFVSFSIDGEGFTNRIGQKLKDRENYATPSRKEVVFENLNQFARYVLVRAVNRKECPRWHAGKVAMLGCLPMKLLLNKFIQFFL